MNLFYWLAHSACAIAFTADSFETTHSPSTHVQRIEAVRALQESPDITFVEAKDEATKKANYQNFTKQINVHPDSPANGRILMEDLSLSVVCDSMTPTRKAERDKNSSSRRLISNPSGSSINTGSPTASLRIKRSTASSPNGSVRGSLGSNVRQESAQHGSFKGDDRKETDWYSGNDQGGSITPSRNEGSVCSSMGPMSSNITLGSALTSITGITRTKATKAHRPESTYDFNIIDLPLLRDINRRVDLNEMASLEYITGGSHSQIYSATWHGQSVIVKVSLLLESIICNFLSSYDKGKYALCRSIYLSGMIGPRSTCVNDALILMLSIMRFHTTTLLMILFQYPLQILPFQYPNSNTPIDLYYPTVTDSERAKSKPHSSHP